MSARDDYPFTLRVEKHPVARQQWQEMWAEIDRLRAVVDRLADCLEDELRTHGCAGSGAQKALADAGRGRAGITRSAPTEQVESAPTNNGSSAAGNSDCPLNQTGS